MYFDLIRLAWVLGTLDHLDHPDHLVFSMSFAYFETKTSADGGSLLDPSNAPHTSDQHSSISLLRENTRRLRVFCVLVGQLELYAPWFTWITWITWFALSFLHILIRKQMQMVDLCFIQQIRLICWISIAPLHL